MEKFVKKYIILVAYSQVNISLKGTKVGRFLILFIMLLSSQTFTSCASKQKALEKAANTPTLIIYQKERTRGDKIPRYTIALLEGKVVKYTGIANVDFIGEKIINIEETAFDAVITQINAIDFESLKTSYKGKMRDLPLTSINYKGHKVFYQEVACPDGLAKLAALIEGLVE